MCNSVIASTNLSGSAAEAPYGKKRLIADTATVPTAATAQYGSTGVYVDVLYDNEVLMASFFHSSYSSADSADQAKLDAADGSKWCSVWANTVEADKEVKLTATMGLDGRSKCTWQLISKDGASAPTIKLTTAFFTDFYFHYFEWSSVTDLGTDATLKATNGGGYQLGAYAGTGVFLNPIIKQWDATPDATYGTWP